MYKEIKSITVIIKNSIDEKEKSDTFSDQHGILSYSISENNNLYIMRDDRLVAYYTEGNWLRLYTGYAS